MFPMRFKPRHVSSQTATSVQGWRGSCGQSDRHPQWVKVVRVPDCIQRSGFDSRRYQIFWEVVGLERGPLSLVSAIEELLGRKSSGSGLESREYGRRDQLL
jgi:hypothetical protein